MSPGRARVARVLRIAAAVILDADGRMLVVRKAGTESFMQPGGKLEAGESAAQCLARELHEELVLVVAARELEPVGRFAAAAANEAGWRVDCDVFRWRGLEATTRPPLDPRAELAQARWCSRAELLGLAADGVLAPLTRDNLETFLSPVE